MNETTPEGVSESRSTHEVPTIAESPFNVDFTVEVLKRCVPTNPDHVALYQALVMVLPKYEITTRERLAAFLSQCGHESVDFKILRENLNYSADALQRVFKKHFPTLALAQQYARQPEKIANRVYANRMGNGSEESGDGWKFRGRGAIQLTGRNNYMSFADSLGITADEAVAYCETLQGAIESACWYWDTNSLNKIADTEDLTLLTRRINGGTHGLEDRVNRYKRCVLALS